MADRRGKAREKADDAEEAYDGPPQWWWRMLFRDQRAPLVRSQLVTALMAGRVLEVERLPVSALPDAVLLSMAARFYCEAEVVDDYAALLRRTDEAWRDPMFTHKMFDSPHLGTLSFVAMGGPAGVTAFSCFEDRYIPDLVRHLLDSDPPEYFSRELTA